MTSRIVMGIGVCMIIASTSRPGSSRAEGVGAHRVTKENLDLPASAGAAIEEVCPLGSVEVADRRFEGDAFIFVVDSSRLVRGIADLEVVQFHLIRAIERLSDGVNLAIIAFDTKVIRYPARGLPVVATESTRDEARRWVRELEAADPICPRAALEEALDLARRLGGRSTMIFYVALDGVLCPGEEEAEYYAETLAAVHQRNAAGVPIHAIGVGAPNSREWNRFLVRLATESGGEYVPICYAR